MLIVCLLGIAKLESQSDKATLGYSALVIWTISFALAFHIKCPKCHERWWWDAVTSPGSGKLVGLNDQESCLNCGYDAESVT